MTEFDKLKEAAVQGRLSRREFIGYASALGIGAAIADPLFMSSAKAAPMRGGTVKIGHAHGSTTDSLDPGTWENDFTIELAFAVNNYLTEINTDGTIKGELAESWEASDDAKSWTFQLRKDVTFHNGKTVTAADVVASFNHHRGAEGSDIRRQADRRPDHGYQGRRQPACGRDYPDRRQCRLPVPGQRLSHPGQAGDG